MKTRVKIKGIDVSRTVKVYRNLKHGRNARPLYSVVQDGRVKARLHRVLLSNAKFVVNEAGRQRVLREKRKNVHAFVVGYLCAATYSEKGQQFPTRLVYNPYTSGSFTIHAPGFEDNGRAVKEACGVLLNEMGITVTFPV